MDLHWINPLYSVSGLGVGLLVGLTGVGGGSLMTPLLVLLFGIHPGTAVGTDLLYAGLTKITGTAVHGSNRTIDWTVTRRLAAGSVPATVLTLLVLAWLGRESSGASHLITTMLGAALILTAVALLFRGLLIERLAPQTEALSEAARRRLTVGLGFALGVLVSISSVGAGAIGVTALVLLYPRLPTARVVGSDIAHAVPLTLIAGAGHWALGSIDWPLLGSLLIGSIPGIMAGSALAGRAPDRVLRPVMAGTLVLVGVRLAF